MIQHTTFTLVKELTYSRILCLFHYLCFLPIRQCQVWMFEGMILNSLNVEDCGGSFFLSKKAIRHASCSVQFGVSSGNPESQLGKVLIQKSKGLIGNVCRSRVDSWFKIVKMRWHLTGFLPYCNDNSSIFFVLLDLLLHNRFFSILPIPCMILLVDPTSQIQSPYKMIFVSLSLIRPSIFWLMQLKSLRFNFLIDLQRNIILMLYFSSQFQLQFRTVFADPHSLLGVNFCSRIFWRFSLFPKHDVSTSIFPFLSVNWKWLKPQNLYPH